MSCKTMCPPGSICNSWTGKCRKCQSFDVPFLRLILNVTEPSMVLSKDELCNLVEEHHVLFPEIPPMSQQLQEKQIRKQAILNQSLRNEIEITKGSIEEAKKDLSFLAREDYDQDHEYENEDEEENTYDHPENDLDDLDDSDN